MTKNRKKSIQEQLDADWHFESGFPPQAADFESMFTNVFGERWWCRRVADAQGRPQLLVWGVDVEARATTKRGSLTEVLPWIMHHEEQLWLLANLGRLKDFERQAAYGT